MTTDEAIVTALAMLGGAFDKPVTKAMGQAWRSALGDLTPEEIQKATTGALRACKFFPAPAELRAFARPPRDLSSEAQKAWAAVRRAIDEIDYTVSGIDFGPVVNAVIRQLGGWDALCRATLTDLDVWKRKEFERLYLLFGDREIGDMGRQLEGPRECRTPNARFSPRVVAIPGLPSQPYTGPALPPVDGGVSDLVRELADGKAFDGGAR